MKKIIAVLLTMILLTVPAFAVSYSTNPDSTVKNGDSGVYAYKSRGGTYSNYYIIDFDEGYVYSFSEGNGSGGCDRVKIDFCDLNSVMVITYHDGDMVLVEHIPDGSALRYGEIGAFVIGNEFYIKEYQADGLHSHNSHYDVMKFMHGKIT